MRAQTFTAKVIHLIPYDGIGGVERAALSMGSVASDDVDFHVETLLPPSAAFKPWIEWNPLYYLFTTLRLWRSRPTLLIVSLWRAYAIGIAVKLLRPGTRLVVFLHFPTHVHRLDRWLTWCAARLALQVWADSSQTLASRLPGLTAGKGRVISFVMERVAPLVNAGNAAVQPAFIFWGRIHPQKGLRRAIALFAAVHAQWPAARFVVIGPDGGDLAAVRQCVDERGLLGTVDFLGGMDFAGIQRAAGKASFYLQTSELEGMAMSVVEAMQLGLVPVVTPVGEIGQYCRSGHNAVIVNDDAAAIREVCQLLRSDACYQTLRANAMATWRDKPLYKDDVLQACRDVLQRGGH